MSVNTSRHRRTQSVHPNFKLNIGYTRPPTASDRLPASRSSFTGKEVVNKQAQRILPIKTIPSNLLCKHCKQWYPKSGCDYCHNAQCVALYPKTGTATQIGIPSANFPKAYKGVYRCTSSTCTICSVGHCTLCQRRRRSPECDLCFHPKCKKVQAASYAPYKCKSAKCKPCKSRVRCLHCSNLAEEGCAMCHRAECIKGFRNDRNKCGPIRSLPYRCGLLSCQRCDQTRCQYCPRPHQPGCQLCFAGKCMQDIADRAERFKVHIPYLCELATCPSCKDPPKLSKDETSRLKRMGLQVLDGL